MKEINNYSASPSTSTDIISTSTTTLSVLTIPPQILKPLKPYKPISTEQSVTAPPPPQQQQQLQEKIKINGPPPSLPAAESIFVKKEKPVESLNLSIESPNVKNHISVANDLSQTIKEEYTKSINNNYDRQKFVKMEFLPTPEKQNKVEKFEKTRDDVSRILSFADDNEKPLTNKSLLVVSQSPSLSESNAVTSNNHNVLLPVLPLAIQTTPASAIITNNTNDIISSKKIESRTNSSSSSHNSNSHRHSGDHKTSSSSSSHRSSRERSSSTSCSKCYRRSKIKKSNIGIQCKRQKCVDETTPQLNTVNESVSSTLPLPYNKLSLKHQSVSTPSLLHFDNLKYERFFHPEVHSNGGASVIHMYQDEIDELSKQELDELVDEFFKICFHEDENGYAYHVMGIVHDAARYLPDLLEHMAENYANLTVKSGVLGRNSDIETCTMQQYNEQVVKNYAQGTFRYGPLHQISLVGKVHEEVGGYFPDLLGRLEANPFLNKVEFIVVLLLYKFILLTNFFNRQCLGVNYQ